MHFISFSCLIALNRTSNTMLTKRDLSEHFCFVHDLIGKSFNFSPLSMMLSVDLSYMAFIILRYVSFILILLRGFVINRYWILLSDFSTSIEMITWFVSFLLLMSHWFTDVEPSLHVWNKYHFIMVYDSFIVILICQYFLEDFCMYVHHGYWPVILFLCVISLPDFCIQVILTVKYIWKSSPSSIFWDNLGWY